MEFTKIEKIARIRKTAIRAVTYMLLSFWALLVLFPFYYMILTSVKTQGAYYSESVPALFTLHPTLKNYYTAFSAVPLGTYFLNTLIFSVATTAVMLVVSVLAAFAFARLKFPGRDLVFTLFLALMMIPTELVVITNFVTVTNLDLRNTFTGLILPSVTSVFYIYNRSTLFPETFTMNDSENFFLISVYFPAASSLLELLPSTYLYMFPVLTATAL